MKRAPKKPRSDSPLRALPEAAQAELIAAMKAGASLAEVRGRVQAAHGFAPSRSALSKFWTWWHLRERFDQDKQTVESLRAELQATVQGVTDEELDDLCGKALALLAAREGDVKGFAMLRNARHTALLGRDKLDLARQAEARAQEALALEREKFRRETCEKVLAAARDERVRAIEASDVSHADKLRALDAILFPEDQPGSGAASSGEPGPGLAGARPSEAQEAFAA